MSDDFDDFGPRPQTFATPPPPPPPVTRTSGTAVATLVLGLTGCCGITAIVGVLLGFSSLGVIRRSGGTVTGRGLAIAGIVLGLAWIGLWAAFWRYPYAIYNTAQTMTTAQGRADAFLRHLKDGEYDEALALTSETHRETGTVEAMRTDFEATVAKLGALQSWTLTRPDFKPEGEGSAIVELRLEFDFVWEKGKSRGAVIFRLDAERLKEGPVEPAVDGFELE